ncbi:MAG: Rieske (2Fe-2S) protein [Gemmatimonadaceae bacterium]|nr:Rieske (2Fe-2S) protein [Gemmatimonadaceae bacterium]
MSGAVTPRVPPSPRCAADCPDAGLRAVPDACDPARRHFLATTLAATVAAFLAACGDGNIGGVTGAESGGGGVTSSGPLVVVLADFPALAADGGIARVDGGGRRPIAVARLTAGTFRAFSMICPHAGYRPIAITGGGFECPNHGARFDAQGRWTGGQRASDLAEYGVTLDALAGTLTVG